jgi:hypothetical protein
MRFLNNVFILPNNSYFPHLQRSMIHSKEYEANGNKHEIGAFLFFLLALDFSVKPEHFAYICIRVHVVILSSQPDIKGCRCLKRGVG